MSTAPPDQKTQDLVGILARNEQQILTDWMREMSSSVRRTDLIKESETQSQCADLLRLTRQALQTGSSDFKGPAWDGVREMLGSISSSRAQQGFTTSETALFVFSAKKPIFDGVAQPAVAVVPVAHAAELLGQRRRGRGHDAAGGRVGERLERDERPLHLRRQPSSWTAGRAGADHSLPPRRRCRRAASTGSSGGGGDSCDGCQRRMNGTTSPAATVKSATVR